MQNMPSFTIYLTQASTDVNLFGSLLHDKIYNFFKGLGQCKQEKTTAFRGQALHAFYVFDVQRIFVRMFYMYREYKIRTMLTNVQLLYRILKKQEKLLLDEYKML